MNSIKFESFVFSDQTHSMNTLPVLKLRFLSVLFFVVGITGSSKRNCEANSSSGR